MVSVDREIIYLKMYSLCFLLESLQYVYRLNQPGSVNLNYQHNSEGACS